MTESSCEALVKLDRKVSRALQNQVGIKLSSADLELLAAIGVISILAEAKAKSLEETARSRSARAVLTGEDHSGSVLIDGEGTASITSEDRSVSVSDASRGRLRAQRMFGLAPST